MGLIEIEIQRQIFQNLVLFLTRQSPIPDPTFEVFGADRLITRFECGDPQRGDVHVGESIPGVAVPPGVVPIRADLLIGHISVAELEAEHPETVAQATGWLYVALEKQGWGPAKGRYALTVRLIRIDVPDGPITQRFDEPGSPRFGRPPLALFPLPLPGTVNGAPVTGAAVFLSGHAATFRLATAGQDVWAARADRLVALEKDWVLRLSPELFTELLGHQLQEAVTPPPGGTELIDGPRAEWANTVILQPKHPEAPAGWGVKGSFRLKKRNACGLLGNVDVSVTVHATLLPVPDVATKSGTFWLEIGIKADDGAAFKCWLGYGGPLLAAFFAGTPLLGLGASLLSLSIVGDLVDSEVNEGLSGQDPGGAFTKIDQGDNYAIYQAPLGIDLSGLDQLLTLDHAVAGPDGLVFAGPARPETAYLGLVGHAPEFTPPGGSIVPGAWSSGYSCRSGWHASYELARIHIVDPIVAQGGAPVPGPDGKPLRLPVAVFPTSYAVPAKHWTIEKPPTVVDQYVSVVGDAWSSGKTTINPQPAHVVLHTSAGLRRFRIGRVPEPPAPPSAARQAEMRVNCMMLVSQGHDVHWLVDPPPFDYGYSPLRHWQLILTGPRENAVTVEGVHEARVEQVTVIGTGTGPVQVEIVTDAETVLRLGSGADQRGNGHRARVRVVQQWLLPTTSVEVGGDAVGLTVSGDRIEVVHPWTVLSVSTGQLAGGGPTAPPAAVALPDGRVAAIHDGRLVLAVPFGGGAVRQPRSPNELDLGVAGHRGVPQVT